MHAKKFCKDFETKYFGEYYDLSVQTDTLLLADTFHNLSAQFFSAPGLAW